MPIGAPGQEQFVDAIVEFRNPHINAGLTPLMTLREELVTNDDFRDRGGIDDITRDYFLALLINCDKWRICVTYNPDGTDIETLKANATNPDAIESDPTPFATDNIQQGTLGLQTLNFALDGSDPNIPLRSALNLTPNASVVLGAIDRCIVAWTRLNSRERSSHITKYDSLRILGYYQNARDYLMTFGGDANRVDVANVRATDEPRGPENAPNRLTETPAGGAS